MFGHDRFGPDQDYLATYRRLGGRGLNESDLRLAVDGCFAALDRLYRDSAYYDSFPSVNAVLGTLSETEGLPAEELLLIEDVVAAHEAGQIADEYAALLRALAQTHRLGIVSNIWSRKDRYLAELERVRILHLFGAVVFSSDGSSMKPSRVLFDQAVDALRVLPQQVVVIGDSLRCDIGGAAAAGLGSVWIDSQGKGTSEGELSPDWIIRDLRDLASDASVPG